MTFLLFVPFAFIVTVIQLLYILNKQSLIGSNTIYKFGFLCLLLMVLFSGSVLSMIIPNMAMFCGGSDCQAAGYVYLIATPVSIAGFFITEFFILLGVAGKAKIEP